MTGFASSIPILLIFPTTDDPIQLRPNFFHQNRGLRVKSGSIAFLGMIKRIFSEMWFSGIFTGVGCISSQKKVFLKKSHFSPTLQARNSKVFEKYFIFFAGNAFSARARYFAPYRTSQLPKSQKLQPVENWYGKPTFFHSKPVGRSWIGTFVD